MMLPALGNCNAPRGLARYRRSLAHTDCFYACPIGSLAMELHEPDQPVRERIAASWPRSC